MRAFIVLAAISTGATAIEFQPDPIYRETIVRQSRPALNGEVFDPQERDPALRPCFEVADKAAERDVGSVERDGTFIPAFWEHKRLRLREACGIDWKSPAMLNPSIRYADYGQPAITPCEERVLRALVKAHLRSPSESITLVERSFEGVASVWTKPGERGLSHEYRFTGHDSSWSFLDAKTWEQ